tara:strand:- start:6357 stop:6581 length:225 start_codon:yes stop_codon:yes gene_type:complete
MQPGDLVKSKKHNAMGIVLDVFGDLDPADRWIRVLFSTLSQTQVWCKEADLELVSNKKEDQSPPFYGAYRSGSL